MHIIIVGGGLVGSTLADRLSRDGHDVSLVESSPARVRELSESLDIRVVEGNGATAAALRRAGIADAELVVAVTDSDEANMTVGRLAPALTGLRRIIVRLRDPDHHEGFDLVSTHLPAEFVRVNPVTAAVDRIASLLEVPGAADVASFMDGELLVVGFQIRESSDFAGLSVSNVQFLFAGSPTLVAAIQRPGGQWLVPGGSDEIHVGDLVYFATARFQLEAVLSLLGAGPQRERKHLVVIAGGGRVGLALAERLERSDSRVVLIDEDPHRAGRAAEALRATIVVQGKATDQTLLEEEQIERAAAFVAVTDDHETNLVSALLAKRLGASRAFALVDNPDLVPLVPDTAVDAIISPRQLAIELALQHIRGIHVRSVAELMGEKIEVLEADVGDESRLTRAPLAELDLPRGVLVAALRRGGKLRVPRGETRIEPGDTVLVIATVEAAKRVAELL